MKTKIAILLAAGLPVWGAVGLAQDQAQDSSTQAAPAGQPGKANEEPAGELIESIVFEDTPLTDVISMLARQAGINFLFAPAVTDPQVGPDGQERPEKTISVRFENVTAQGALAAVLENHGLQLIPNQKTNIGQIAIKDPAALPPLLTQIVQLNHTTPSNLVAAITASISERGAVIPDLRTSQLVVIATEMELEGINELIARLDIATKQVLIEAQIIETSVNPTSIKGIDWTGTLGAQNVTFGNGVTTGTTTTSSPGATSTSNVVLPGGTTVTQTRAASSSSATDLVTAIGNGGLSLNTMSGLSPQTAFLNADGVRATLSFLNTDADSKVVATPRTVTKDNQVARLEVTRAFPIFNVSPGSANTPATAQITYTNLGTILEVTPRISASSNIFMTITPEVSNIDSKNTQTIAGEVFEANVYAIRRINTAVEIPDGDTLVMGGLMSNTETDQYTKVPILGDIPVLGLLFRRDSKSKQKANLIIFITPSIIRPHDFQYVPSNFMRNSLKGNEQPRAWDGDATDDVGAWNRGKPAGLLRKGN